jgi:hypothetical protein
MRVGIVLISALMLLGCGTQGQMLGQAPVTTFRSAKPYEIVATCSFERLNAQQGSAVHKADLPTEGKSLVSIDTGSVKYFEAIFQGTSQNQTTIEITSAQTMWGPFPVEKMIAEVKACAG